MVEKLASQRDLAPGTSTDAAYASSVASPVGSPAFASASSGDDGGGDSPASIGTPRAAVAETAAERKAAKLEAQARIEKAALEPLKDRNHYDVMGLGDKGPDATDDDLRRAYRKLVLKFHPDKHKSGGKDERQTNTIFLAIKKAYEILGDPSRRREYDSRFEFDEGIPSGKEPIMTEEDFFELYGPVFVRNARFAATTPVPELGAADSSAEDVDRFYRFWFEFKSWREFADRDEHDPEMADSRDERRWMQQQNERARAKLKAADNDRLSKLVTRAHANDPRIRAARRAEKEAKLQRKRERVADRERALAAKEAAKEAREAAAKAALEAEAEAALEARDRGREARSALRAIARPLVATGVRVTVRVEQDVRLKPAPKPPGKEKGKRAAAAEEEEEEEEEEGGGELVRVEAEETAAVSEADLRLLTAKLETEELEELLGSTAAALGALPPGAAPDAAWPGTAAALQVLLRAVVVMRETAKAEAAAVEARLAGGKAGKKSGAGPDWSGEELSALAKGMRRFPGGIKGRWEAVAMHINSLGLAHKRSSKECIAKAEAIRSGAPTTPTAGAAAAVSPMAASPVAAAADDWTAEQQCALEAALRANPASKTVSTKERWKAIAAMVPDKSMKDCAARYKALRASLKTKA